MTTDKPEVVRDQQEVRVNKRKLFELPFHLLKSKNHDALKDEVFFNFEYIFATLKVRLSGWWWWGRGSSLKNCFILGPVQL